MNQLPHKLAPTGNVVLRRNTQNYTKVAFNLEYFYGGTPCEAVWRDIDKRFFVGDSKCLGYFVTLPFFRILTDVR